MPRSLVRKKGLCCRPHAAWQRHEDHRYRGWQHLPLAVAVDSASPAECQLVEYVLAGSFLDELRARMIGDKAYDSDKLDQRMRELYDIEMIAPNRSRTQDGRKLRRYSRRWRVERLFAWMQNFRRLVTRWEYHIENFLGFVHLACVQMLFRHL